MFFKSFFKKNFSFLKISINYSLPTLTSRFRRNEAEYAMNDVIIFIYGNMDDLYSYIQSV